MTQANLKRRSVLGRLALLAGLAAMRPGRAADARPLVFGVFPGLTAKQTVELYRPLADILEKHLHRPVAIYSARDFRTFVARTRQGEYDILLTAPHLAWLARQDAGYQPLLKYARQVRGLLVVKSGSSLDNVEALRGRTIATPDPIALVVLAMQAQLAARGLKHNIDYRTVESGTHTNAVLQVINGRTDAAIVGMHPYRLMSANWHQQLRLLAETPPLSSLMYLTHPRLRDAEVQAIRRILLDFAASPQGQDFMRNGDFGGYIEVDGSELRAFRPYALQVQDLLQQTP